MIKTTTLGIAAGASTGLVAYEYLKWKSQSASATEANSKREAGPEIIDTIYANKLCDEKVSSLFKREKSKNKNKIKHQHNALKSHTISYNKKYKKVVPKLFSLLQLAKEETGSPGISFAISHNGELVMKGGIGLADVENGVLCTSDTSMRIASISKSLTTVAIGKLIESGMLDIDQPVHSYLKEFGAKTFDGEPVDITTRQLLSHTSGIRGYFEDPKKYDEEKAKTDPKFRIKHEIMKGKFGELPTKKTWNENYSMKHYKKVQDGLALFQDDPLIYKPGTDFEYSSLAYSLVSRIIEESSGKDYITYMRGVRNDLGMVNTFVDLNNLIVLNRSKNYRRSKKNHKLKNTPYVDNSYKWSGGGFLSNVNDLVRFGNSMLTSYSTEKGYLKPDTVQTLWQPEKVSIGRYGNYGYALGWAVQEKTDLKQFAVHHTGGAIGASSVLMVIPGNSSTKTAEKQDSKTEGTVIALIVNMQSVGLLNIAEKLGDILAEEC